LWLQRATVPPRTCVPNLLASCGPPVAGKNTAAVCLRKPCRTPVSGNEHTVLPIRVLPPARADRLVGEVEDVLQVAQPDHQPGQLRRPAERSVEPPELTVELLPLDQPGEPVQLVALVEQVLQTAAVEIAARGGGCRRLRTRRKNTGFAGSISAIPYSTAFAERRESLPDQSLGRFSGPTS
jgi:hypothetical protein